MKLKVRAVGSAKGLILPKEALRHLGVAEGDELNLIATSDGYTITSYDPEFARQMQIAKDGMKKYKNALRELAK